jgi:pyruvate,water dikinase
MHEWTRAFEEVGAGDVAVVGGKAANLGEMTRAGLPVPPGFCVTAGAYRRFVGESGVAERIERLLSGLKSGSPAAVEHVAAQIRMAITENEVPSAITDAILDRYRRLAEALDLPVEERSALPVAVRSSATAEDLPDASFAGQQDTYLNVRGEEALLEHVRHCWASLWTARAVTYRAQHGYDHEKVALAVAIQSMVSADVAGVMFTADPVTSDRSRLIVNASWGLGEAIVSGLVTPDTWAIDKRDGAIATRDIGHKEREVVRSVEGGTLEREVPPDRRDVPSLSDAQLGELADLGEAVERHYDTPMDVEWAYAGGRMFLLQARPITTLAAAPAIDAADGDYNRTMFLEIFPDPLSPAFMSVIVPLFGGMLDFTFRTLGFRSPRGIPAVGSFTSQPYFNQRYIEAALAPLRPRTRAAIVAQIVNPFGRHERAAPFELSMPYLRMSWRLLKLMRSLHRLLPRVVASYRGEIAELERLPVTELSEPELVRGIRRLVFRTASRLLDYDFLLIALVGVMYQTLGSLLERYFGDESEEMRARLVSGVTGNATMETNKRLWDLAQAARASEVVSGELRGSEAGEVVQRLAGTPQGRAFIAELERFLAEYGHREIRMDILYPTWVEDPRPVLSFIRGYLDVGEASSPYLQQERLVRAREQLAETVSRRVRGDLRGRFLVGPIFDWVLRHSQANTRQRDTMHFELTRLFPPLRRLLLELGKRWTARGLIGRADDVFFLTLDEIEQAADSTGSLQGRIDLRRRELEADRRRSAAPIVRDGREIWEDGPVQQSGTAAGELRGVAGSPGRASGVVRIVRDPDDFHRLADGEILVAPLTNPVWTPLFAIAGGLVTEVGGILSHGAIVAREYGVPAVMAVSGATEMLHDGQLVTVDGSRGLVQVVESGP